MLPPTALLRSGEIERGMLTELEPVAQFVGKDMYVLAVTFNVTTALMQHMFFAHAVEGAGDSGRVLRLLPDECVSYVGPEPRTSPRSAKG